MAFSGTLTLMPPLANWSSSPSDFILLTDLTLFSCNCSRSASSINPLLSLYSGLFIIAIPDSSSKSGICTSKPSKNPPSPNVFDKFIYWLHIAKTIKYPNTIPALYRQPCELVFCHNIILITVAKMKHTTANIISLFYINFILSLNSPFKNCFLF